MKKLVLSILALGLWPFMAQAHATPISYSPESSSVLESVPEQIEIIFSERIEPGASSINVIGPDGSSANAGRAVVDPDNRYRYYAGLNDAGEGTYVVSWQVVSADDGHFTRGAFTFFIGFAGGATPGVSSTGSFEVVHSSALNETFFMWLELLGQALVIGVLALMLLMKRASLGFGDGFNNRLKMVLWSGLIFSSLGAGAYLVLKSFELAELQNIGRLSALYNFISTTTGSFSAYRLVAYIFGVIVLVFQKNIFSRKLFYILGLVFILAVFARARVSHAAASHFLPVFSVMINFIHLFFKEMWVGLVLVLSVTAISFRKKLTPGFLSEFSRLLLVCLLVSGITGVYIIWLHLKDPMNIFATDWGIKFVLLSVLAVVMATLRISNHFRPNLFRIFSEGLVGAALLFVTSSIIITTPPLFTSGFQASVRDQGVKIILKDHPYEDENFIIEVRDKNATERMTVTATEEARGIGPIIIDLEKRFQGGYAFSHRVLAPGEWEINITAGREGTYDANASFTVRYPEDLEKDSGFGWFHAQSILAALAVMILFLFLFKRKPATEFENGMSGTRKSFIRAVAYSALLFSFLWFADYAVLHKFRTICEGNGDMWHQMSPMRNGQVLSAHSVSGCMVKEGNYHFVDAKEYEHYLKPVDIITEMTLPDGSIMAGRPVELEFSVLDEKGRPAALTLTHERLLHTVIISEDLSVFAHIHPEDFGRVGNKDGNYRVRYAFPKAGKYLVAVDIAVNNQLFPKQFYVDVAGAPGMSPSSANFERERMFSDYMVRLSSSRLATDRWSDLWLGFEKDGKPVLDLQPYLGAAMHISIVKDDLSRFIHAHGEVHLPGQSPSLPSDSSAAHVHAPPPLFFGPDVEAHVIFPEAGIYKVFGEFNHRGRVIVSEFYVEVY